MNLIREDNMLCLRVVFSVLVKLLIDLNFFVAEKKSVKWYFRIASIHGPKMALPFIKSIEVTLKFYCAGSIFMYVTTLMALSSVARVLPDL